MFGPSEKTFTVYEKPEAAEPTDRVVLVREGFSFWAFALHILWLLGNRLWLVALGYVVAMGLIVEVGGMLQVSAISIGILQAGLQVLLGFNAYDLEAMTLRRKGYRFAGVIVAESPMHAQRRYHEFAA
ncbi:MAG: DUF2628 domain-containing protein [Pseudomonadota bacterium]